MQKQDNDLLTKYYILYMLLCITVSLRQFLVRLKGLTVVTEIAFRIDKLQCLR